jgi:GT2 family glycosyltransferase
MLSVVIAVRDAADTLDGQLASLAGQDYQGQWELIVADNGSSDGSLEVARSRAPELPLRIVDASRQIGAAYARNVGARAALGELLAFCDADDSAHPGWLSGLAHASREGDLIAGALDVDHLNDPRTRSWHERPPPDRALVGHDFLPFASGGNCAIWSATFRRLGGFSETYRWGEDVELSWRAQLAGYTLCFATDAVMRQRQRTALRQVARQHFCWGRANGRLFRDFRAAGMPRSSLGEAARSWARLGYTAPRMPWSPRARGRWTLELALRSGQIAGSVANRVVFL